MTTLLAPLPVQAFKDSNGNPLSGGQLYTYVAGTSTLITTYTDVTAATPNTNPIILNSRGECNLWLSSGLAYKLVLQDSYGVLIWSVDQITSAAAAGANSDITSLGAVTGITAVQLDNTTKLATTGFVQQAGVHFQPANGYGISTSQTLSASMAGHWVEVSTAGITVTLPPSTPLTPGLSTYTIKALVSFTIAASSGETINFAASNGQASALIYAGQTITLVSNGAAGWYAVAEGFGSKSFALSTNNPGYQKLPSGLIIQWGYGVTSASGSIAFTLPIAFPSACLSATGNGNSSAVQAVIVTVGVSASTVTVYAANPSAVGVSTGVFFMAVGV